MEQRKVKLALVGGGTLVVMLLLGVKAVHATRRSKSDRKIIWNFGPPLANAKAAGDNGWWDSRSYRGGVHQGIDLAVPVGTPVYSIGDGTVIRAKNDDSGFAGRFIAVEHEYGLISRYLHLNSLNVKNGNLVKRGQHIGYTGATGSGDAHLHFDLRIRKQFLSIWQKVFGTPTTGFLPAWNDDTIGVPTEPLVPITYTDAIIRNAGKYGILVHGVTRPATGISMN